jgi:hypothetical protein
MMVDTKLLAANAALLFPIAFAASISSSSIPSITFATPSGYSTKSYNAAAASTTISYQYTNEELAMLWNQVGKISLGNVTTTVLPTPEPTAYPRPGVFHPQVLLLATAIITHKS